MTSLYVEIPGTPNRDMTPNGRAHWGRKARLTAQARSDAHYATKQALQEYDGLDLYSALSGASEIKVAITIRWEPYRKTMDQDNAIASVKSHLDGVAEAIGRNDKVFRILGVDQERDPDGLGHVAVSLMPVGEEQS